jgi:O-antigen/teichoic acid export membrane protein
MFTNLSLRSAQATDARREYDFSDYLGLRLLCAGPALVIVAAAVMLGGYGGVTALTIMLVGLAKVFESISDIYYGLLQQRERMDRIAKSMIIKGILSLAALGAAVLLTGSVVWGAVGLAVAWAVVLSTYDVRSGALILRGSQARGSSRRVVLRPRFSFRPLSHLAWLALPLGVVMLLNSLDANLPRYFVEKDMGARDLGFYAAVAYLLVAGNTVVNALGQAASPRLAHFYAAGETSAYRALLLKTLCVGAFLGALGVGISLIAGHWLLSILYRPAYAAHTDVFVWLMIAAVPLYLVSFLGYGMTAARYFRVQAPLLGIVTLFLIVACAALVPRFGLVGAAYATGLAMLVQLVLSVVVIVHAMSRPTVQARG